MKGKVYLIVECDCWRSFDSYCIKQMSPDKAAIEKLYDKLIPGYLASATDTRWLLMIGEYDPSSVPDGDILDSNVLEKCVFRGQD